MLTKGWAEKLPQAIGEAARDFLSPPGPAAVATTLGLTPLPYLHTLAAHTLAPATAAAVAAALFTAPFRALAAAALSSIGAALAGGAVALPLAGFFSDLGRAGYFRSLGLLGCFGHRLLGSFGHLGPALATLGGWVYSRLPFAVADLDIQISVALFARIAAAAYAFYFTWWHAFPAEALTRRRFRAKLLPLLPPVNTAGSWLLHRLGVAGIPLGGDELVARTTVAARPRRPSTPNDEPLGHPFPSFLSRQTQPEEGFRTSSIWEQVGRGEGWIGKGGLSEEGRMNH
jgi:hypothetical protein